MSNLAGLPASPGISIAGVSFPDVRNLIILHGYATGANRYCALRAAGTAAGYQVTVGKTLTVYAMTFISEGTAPAPTVFYHDTDTGWRTNTAPTNPSYVVGSNISPFVVPTTAGVKVEYVTKFAVPATKFLGIDMGGTAGAGATFYCYEA